MRYEFPWPPRALSPNSRAHWRQVARMKANYKEHCGWIIRGEYHDTVPQVRPPVAAQVTFVCDARRRDSDNHMAMLKPMWDALVEMGVLEDDSRDVLRILDPKWEIGEKKVIVELTAFHDGGE